MRYAYAITAALLIGGTTLALTDSRSVVAQTAQNEGLAASAPNGGPTSFAPMVEKLQPAVVNISTRQRIKVQANPLAGTPFGNLFGFGGDGQTQTRQAQALGSGFIISPDGYIVTNNHVISPGAKGATVDSITVIMPDRTEYPAKVVGKDTRSDLAVLKIDAKKPLPFVKFGDSTKARVGDWVIAIGNPFGLGSTVTVGIVSALHRNTDLGGADRFIQTDASINQGNSGGPMFDMKGEVIGINSQILSPTGGNVGIGFAIPSEQAVPIINQLRQGEKVQRGYLGISITPLSDDMADSLGLPKHHGELVQSVEPGKGAAKAGIKPGDVIVRIDGKDVTPDNTLSYLVANLKVGATAPIELMRGGKKMTLNAQISQRPPESELADFAHQQGDENGLPDENEATAKQASQQLLGLAVTPMTPSIASQLGVDQSTRGVVVTAVDPSSDAGAKGLRRGDIVMMANGRAVASPAQLGEAAQAAKKDGRNAVLLQVLRRGNPAMFIAIRLNDSK